MRARKGLEIAMLVRSSDRNLSDMIISQGKEFLNFDIICVVIFGLLICLSIDKC